MAADLMALISKLAADSPLMRSITREAIILGKGVPHTPLPPGALLPGPRPLSRAFTSSRSGGKRGE